MKALVKKQSAPGLWLEDVPEPDFGINDVLIRVSHTGICGTDLHIYEWDDWARSTIPVPMVIGHEFVVEVVAVGSDVNDFHLGEVVSGEGRRVRAVTDQYSGCFRSCSHGRHYGRKDLGERGRGKCRHGQPFLRLGS